MLSVQQVLAHISHELGGGEPSIELDKFRFVNGAGEHLHSMYPWKWAQGRSALLDLRGSVSGATATWTAATLTLTQASGFTNYTFLEGDEIEILDGTGATTGVYKVASRVSANAVTLETSLAAGNLATGDIEWAIYPGTIDLPDDLRDIISIQPSTTASSIHVSLTSLDEINGLRGANAVTISPALYQAALVYAGTPPTPILEVWPSPSANQTGALRIFYRARWVHTYSDATLIPIPEFCEDLYIQIARVFASGYERNEQASLHARLQAIAVSPVFDAAKRSDGQAQPFRRVRNGGAMIHRHRLRDHGWIANRVAPPI